MPPRSQLEINTSSVLRLVKEEASYHQEAVQQTERIKKLENEQSEDENREFLLQQERRALDETKKVFPSLKKKLHDIVTELESLIAEEAAKGSDSNVDQITAAKEAIAQAKTAEREVS
ncbi:Uncharacterized protein PECH_005227 [Penicillium ucsense]|uniref:Tubulin-specific chaperone A n=2 Tax=Penicillium TaxID=5073 RepID=A0A8J8WK28_9EURO|nr:uncharacterized protein N7539_005408 [Penicillium diatomitis]KAF7719486.1 Uncharacterized protein PECM_006339 [Penicillium ucsense]KAF7736494.1 Uncharacterized protein PECH_005227 [Penicillium ucsense]KAJ5485420.1 hypothetical protein N7539_005408 [Penicillium diatomitis]